jgi:UDP-N-acetylmuramate dehydrogenase
MKIREILESDDFGEVKENESMTLHTTYKVGGKCDYFVQPNSIDSLVKLIDLLQSLYLTESIE